jgi:hypothetical protein
MNYFSHTGNHQKVTELVVEPVTDPVAEPAAEQVIKAMAVPRSVRNTTSV